MLPLPSELTALVLSFIPPELSELTRESPLPEDAFINMVLGSNRYQYANARFYLMNDQYDFLITMKRGDFNAATYEAPLILQYRNLPIADVITVGDILPRSKTPQAIEPLYKSNAEIYFEQIMRGFIFF